MKVLLGIFDMLLLPVLHLGIVGLDITIFFLLMKFLAMQWPELPLAARFDLIGSPLVDDLIATTKRIGNVTYRASFFWLSIVLSAIRVFLVTITNAMLAA